MLIVEYWVCCLRTARNSKGAVVILDMALAEDPEFVFRGRYCSDRRKKKISVAYVIEDRISTPGRYTPQLFSGTEDGAKEEQVGQSMERRKKESTERSFLVLPGDEKKYTRDLFTFSSSSQPAQVLFLFLF